MAIVYLLVVYFSGGQTGHDWKSTFDLNLTVQAKVNNFPKQ